MLYSWTVERLFKKIPRAYFTINNALKTYLEAVGIPASRIEIFAMDTINRDREYIDKAQKGIIRERYSLGADDVLLMCVGRLEAEKNYPRLLLLFANLPKNYYLAILGQGSLKKELEALCVAYGISERVFFAGFVQRDDIWNFYLDADLFVLLSKAESLGVVFWEAMYMKVPCLGSTADGIVESLGTKGERGLVLTENENEKDFAEKVKYLVTPSSQRGQMLDSARKYVETQIENKVTINSLYERL